MENPELRKWEKRREEIEKKISLHRKQIDYLLDLRWNVDEQISEIKKEIKRKKG